jgi:isopentenyl diphosphate isomerase/L-lactate dehydrogenase-like FMN-dependent dehydrogenase
MQLNWPVYVMLINNTDPDKLEQRAKEKLSEGGWYYASSNAGYSTTHLANRQAFYRHRIIPRMLVDTNKRDTAWEIWGHKVSAPIGFSPIGINKIYNPLGEPIEDVGTANGDGPRFFQLYMPHDDELTVSLLRRAIDSGFTACILTVEYVVS